MEVREYQVGIADYKVTRQPHRLVTLGLGSCVGISLYDPVVRVGGLVHIMLPDSKQFSNVTKPAKFADLGIPLLVEELRRQGGQLRRLEAKLAGGAQMFSGQDRNFNFAIGERNVAMSRKVLQELGVRIVAEDVGGNRGRTMILDTATGQVTVRTLGNQARVM